MKGITNLQVYYNGEVIPNTHEGVTFVCECLLSFAIPCTMSFVELQNGLCNNIQSHILKMVSNLLYRSPVQVFGGLIQFQIMPITDNASMQQMLYVYQQTQSHVPMIELYIEFEQQSGIRGGRSTLGADWEEDNNDNKEEFEANYEVDDENDDGDLASNPAVQNEANAIVSQHPFGEGNVAAEDGEFSVGIEFGSTESVISVIKNYTISRGVDYTGYGAGCDWLIRASLIRKKVCWKIRRYNGKHTCTIGTISQDHAKLDSKTIADAIRPLVEAILGRSRSTTKTTKGNIVVNRFDWRNEMFEVREIQDDTIYTVNLAQRHCDCGHFQVERLPCRHVLASCVNQHLNWQVYVHDVYKMSEICKVYRGEFVPMGNPSTWDRYKGAKVIANWTLRRATKGRPKSTRYLNEMDSRDMRGPRWCTICGREGHSRSRCPQRAGPSSAGDH
ncbi:hypothetical protein Ahy_A03g011572 [Arachis hypogaea]|uniref:SWIM-type domain-containing protein n=1 Tax=Arachis hypogaea TaxID=3818 RepID=A0A445DR38_ARAHY|nr:hypothetical protein Ahy_A03g011572 [Arachis hypogaea]